MSFISQQDTPEIVEAPLSSEELGARYRAICEDPCYANIPGKLELDVWGRMLMSPASNYHGALQLESGARLKALGGQAFDVAWADDEFMRAHAFETRYAQSPQICVEIVSPSNSRKELWEKTDAHLGAGAREVWVVYPKSKRFEFYGERGLQPGSAYAVDLAGVFK